MFAYVTSAKTFIISSPDKQNTIRVRVDKDIRWSLSRGTEILLNENVINIKLTGGSVLGTNPVVLKTFAEKANEPKKFIRIIRV